MMKKLICAALSLALLQSIAFAETFNKTLIGDEVVTYLGSANSNSTVTFTVLEPSMSLDEFMDITKDKKPICYQELKVNDDGKYTVVFDIGGVSDTYNIYVGTTGMSEIDHIALRYINEDENERARDSLFADDADIANVIKDNVKACGVRRTLFNKMDDELYTEAASIYRASGNVENTLEAVTAACEKAIAIALWNDDKIELFGNDGDAFGIPESVARWYEKSYMNASVMNDISKDISKTLESFDKFDKTIAKVTALAVIEYADGYGDVQTCLKDNADLLGINESKVTVAFCKSIIGKRYDSIDDIGIETFKAPSSNLGGSTTGGGGSAYRNTSIQSNDVKPEPVKESLAMFLDMEDFAWAMEAVNALYTRGVLNGKSEKIFAPADNVLREEFAKMVMSSVEFETLAGEVQFDDVAVSDWYYDYVTQAYLCGVINGESESSFGSGKKITRQDMAVMCYNALVKKGVIDEENEIILEYTDSAEISDYAHNAVGVLTSLKILTGNDDNSFIPHGFATRAEAAQMIYKALKFIEEV